MIFDVELPGARAIFSTRHGGVSEGPYESLNLGLLTEDQPDNVRENRRRLADRAGLGSDRVAMGWQVHGADLKEWDGPPAIDVSDPRRDLDHVDGHLTGTPGVGLMVLVADCLPVALAGGGRVAMLHCGWRPLAAGVIEKAVARFDEPPEAVIGPGIGPCCYEVGPEVLERFAELDGVADGRMLDLKAVARRKLEAAGAARVADLDLCTSCRADLFFSHRRDHGLTGRQAGIAWLS